MLKCLTMQFSYRNNIIWLLRILSIIKKKLSIPESANFWTLSMYIDTFKVQFELGVDGGCHIYYLLMLLRVMTSCYILDPSIY